MRSLCILFFCFLCALPGVLRGQLVQYAEIAVPAIPISYSFEKPILKRDYSLCLDDVSVEVCCEENNKNWYAQFTGLPFYRDSHGNRVEAKLLQSSAKICTQYCIGSDALLKQYKYLFEILTGISYTTVGQFILDRYGYGNRPDSEDFPAIEKFWSLLAYAGLLVNAPNSGTIWPAARNFLAAMLIRDYVGTDDVTKRICQWLAKNDLLTKDEQSKLGMSAQGFSAIALQNTGAHLDSHNKPYTFVDKEAEAKMIGRFRGAFLDALKNDPEMAKAAVALFPVPTYTPAFTIVKDDASPKKEEAQHHVPKPHGKTILTRFWESSWRTPTLVLCTVGAICYFAKKSDPRNWYLSGWLKPVQGIFAGFGVGSFFSRAPSIRAMSAANSFE